MVGGKLLAKAMAKVVARDAAMRAAVAAPAVLTKKAAREALRREWRPASELPIVTQAAQKGLRLGGAEQMALQHTSGFSPWASIKPRVPEEQFKATYLPTAKMGSPARFDAERLRGAHIVPLVGDRSIAGQRLTSLNDMPVDVDLQGGPRYGEANAARGSGAVWASGKPIITRLQNAARDALERGQDVYAMHLGMSPAAVDQTMMMADLLTQQVRQSDILKKHLKAFNKDTRTVLPGFPGIEHAEAREFLKGVPQKARAEMVARMDTAPMLEQGFPDVAHARIALTEPGLREMPGGAAGFSVSKLGPESLQAHAPTLHHETYPVQMAGTPVGALESLVPYDKLLPGMYGQRRAAGIPAGGDIKSLEWSNWAGTLDERSHDTLMRYLEGVRK